MFGPTDPRTWMIVLYAAVAAAFDLKKRKIPNTLNLTAVVVGLFYAIVSAGYSGLEQSLLGSAVGLGLFYIVYLLKAIGAGDVKFLAGLGALGGAEFALKVAASSVLIAAFFGIIQLIVNKRFIDFVQRVVSFQFLRAQTLDPSLKFPFGVAMGVAACAIVGGVLG